MNEDRDGLDAQQREAVLHTQGPLLIVAGPGSGKTRVITHRIAHIITAGLAPPSGILAVTFTRKAAGVMRERALGLLEGQPMDSFPTITTFHSFCTRFLRSDGGALAQVRPGFSVKFHIFDTSDQRRIIKDCYTARGLTESFMKSKTLLGIISRAKNSKLSAADLLDGAVSDKDRVIADIFKLYEDALLRENALDFDDILGEAVRLLRHDDATRMAWNRRLEYIMVDEFQDTNPVQYDLIRLLTQRQQNIGVVGDDDQGIYSWRGATIANVGNFQRDYPKVKVVRLERNYRSSQNIVAASRAVIENNRERMHKELRTELPPGPPIGLYEADDVNEEAAFVAHCVTRYQASNSAGDIAVLYRNNYQSGVIEQALRRCGVSYKVVRGVSFFEREEIKVVVAYLKLAIGNCDSLSLMRVINTPTRGIGDKKQKDLRRYAQEKGLDLMSAVEQMPDQKLASFRGVIKDLSAAAGSSSLPELIRFIIDRTKYEALLRQDHEEELKEGKSRLDNVMELIEMAAEATGRGETASDFLDYMVLASDADAYDENVRVSLMTLHTAKGLEFSMVLMCGIEQGLLPSDRALRSESRWLAVEEERRLFYVGLTRSKGLLMLSHARRRMQYSRGGASDTAPSQFLAELSRSRVIDDLTPMKRETARRERPWIPPSLTAGSSV
jgi:DNA helicase II / ATP-dependent DNA helicase PcrA